MPKKILLTILALCFLFSMTAGTASAKPQIDVYRNNSRDLNKIVNVVVLPAAVSADIPEEEHFFAETLEQLWDEIIAKMEGGKRFKITREGVYTSPASPDSATEDDAGRAELMARFWTPDAVMTLTVTEAIYGVISREAQSRWIPQVRLGGGYWCGDWHPRGGVMLQKENTPAHDEFYSTVFLKIEIRDPHDGQNTLLYGVSVRETARSGMLPNQPSLTKLLDSALKAAAARLAKM